jgi:hypothetical protein
MGVFGKVGGYLDHEVTGVQVGLEEKEVVEGEGLPTNSMELSTTRDATRC